MPSKTTPANKFCLALQGGGTHGAFTWGVIDQLLTDGRSEIEAISATSGGALMAAVCAQGMLDGGNEGAREALKQFWRKVSIASSLLPMRMTIVDKFLGHVGVDVSPSTIALDYITRMFSPSQFNLFDINPLRGIVDEIVDFKALNKKSPMALYINATNARTGKSKIFDHSKLTLEAVMASACLPFIFKTVEIDGEPYWDGSFSGCPSLSPLISHHSDTPDLLLVQVHPAIVDEVPTAAADILDRATEMSFHSVLLHELRDIELHNKMLEVEKSSKKPVTVHTIDAADMLVSLGRASKLNAEWDFLVYMHDLGVQAATDWLKNHYGA